MKYKDFVRSIHESKVHKVVPFESDIKIEVDRAFYLLGTSGTFLKKYFLHDIKSIKKTVYSFLDRHPLEKNDRWWVSLSTQHVAGFSILARSYFAGLKKPLEEPFNLNAVKMKKEGITVISLVPTQVFDLVAKRIKAPSTLKYVFVGGASLSDELFVKAKSLGWPLYSCFGSTETFAQFASSKNNKDYEVYNTWFIKSNKKGELEIKGPSVFTHHVFENGSVKPISKNWLTLKDKVLVSGTSFSFEGRLDDHYKSKGVYRNFFEQKKKFEKAMLLANFQLSQSLLVVLKEERSGAGLYLLVSNEKILDLAFKILPEIRGGFLFKDLSLFLSEIGKPSKAKIESAVSRPLLLS